MAKPAPPGGAAGLASWQVALPGLAWLGGVALQLQQAALWPQPGLRWALAIALALVVLAGLAWRHWPQRAAVAWGLLCLGVAGLAFAGTALRAADRLAERLDPALEGLDLIVTGVVAVMPQQDAAGARFAFEVEQAWHRGRPVRLPARLTLGWWSGFDESAWFDEPRAALQAGQRWRLPLRLKALHGAMNPHGFDVELWWFEQGLGANGSVRVQRGGPPAQLLAETGAHPVERLRGQLRDAIRRQVPDGRVAGVLAALVVGDQAAIERADWELFRATGIAHLVSISGVHVTMLAWLAAAGVAWLWRRWPRGMLAVPLPVAARWGGLLLATAYALLAGWGVPAQRTVLMLAMAAALRSTGVRWPWLLVLLLAAVVVTLADPWALLQAGFWLSFAAVALLLLSEPVTRGLHRPRDAAALPDTRRTRLHRLGGRLGAALAAHGRAQLVATLGLAPLSLVFFGQVSLVGWVANLVAIPLVTLLITPLALAGVLLPPLWSLTGALVQAGVAGLGWLASAPVAQWTTAVAPAWAVASGLAGALLGVLPLPWRLRGLALPLVLPLLWPASERPVPGQMQILVADVGQGTAVLVRTHAHLLVYDTGPQISRDSDAGQRVLLPLLRARGERHIDRLMLSHRDADHVGGAATLLDALPVADVWSSLPDEHPLRARPLPHTRCQAGLGWVWDGVQFALLHPTPADYASAVKPNAVSCVLRITDASGRSALLTGDIEAQQEAAMLQRLPPAALASQVLLVPHHGSRTSSTAALLDAVAPRWAVVQAAYRSRFGHPAPEVLARYADRRIEVVRTDQCGAWKWQDGAVECTREVRRRYWHWQPSAPLVETLVR
ncbi:DNA internalization-related competence protein ComEC/Rec2 [Aquabacterium sp. OR-4]|uniref:DNA internalization-related competence protein ComEC/Rec2 n=1 Tax=Aquabacterium sp. OR-4 TaxID=2978127 RepID=UPI0021B44ACD|nr:DNA internalization-related competence protein ComEC/Rec2 [Aquabacterium sp. OR-4]MDT7835224.1 DNA internalization-related competence protein ComEC/Rec2 [Aquabacterium sp. OR-4]